MSLGSVRGSGHTATPKDTPVQHLPSPMPRARTRRLTLCSIWSCCAVLTCASAFSILSIGSTLSLLSIGSTLSLLSIGSTLSLLSIGSVASTLSVGSYGCYGKFFSNCHRAGWDGAVALDVRFTAQTWDRMATCDFDGYQRYKKYKTADHPCAYHGATCTYAHGNHTRTIPCKVRRKGFSTFRALDAAPSFKVKFYADAAYASKLDLELGDLGRVPGVVADKATFNNMAYSTSYSGYGEVEAYDTFHRMDYPGMPGATYAQITTYRADVRVNRYVGSVVEDANNDDYFARMAHEYGTNYLLLEVDNTGVEYKTAKGTLKQTVDRKLLAKLLNREEEEGEDGVLALMQAEEVSKFYAGERLTHNWDGACLRVVPNNFYIVVWEAADGTHRVRFLPKGMDWVYQGCVYALYTDAHAYCGPVQRLLATNASGVDAVHAAYAERVPYRATTCGQEVGYLFLFLVLSTLAAFFCTVAGVRLTAVLARRKEEGVSNPVRLETDVVVVRGEDAERPRRHAHRVGAREESRARRALAAHAGVLSL